MNTVSFGACTPAAMYVAPHQPAFGTDPTHPHFGNTPGHQPVFGTDPAHPHFGTSDDNVRVHRLNHLA